MAIFSDTCNECGNEVEIDVDVCDIYSVLTTSEMRNMAEYVEDYIEPEEKESVIEETLSDLGGVTGGEFADAITKLSGAYYKLTPEETELIISLAKRF